MKEVEHSALSIQIGNSELTEVGVWHMGQLIHYGRMTHICVGNLTIIGLDNGVLLIGHSRINVWNFNRNSYIFIPENASEIAAILSRP